MRRMAKMLALVSVSVVACGTDRETPLASHEEQDGESTFRAYAWYGPVPSRKAISEPAAGLRETRSQRLLPIPNDELYGHEQAEYMKQIKLPEGWSITTGSPDVIIAIIDTGVDIDHPDIQDNIWRNPREVRNGADDDGNGYVDDIHGWDFVDNVPDPNPKAEQADNFAAATHGTMVAGVAASATDNGIGLAGVCWSCTIMPLRAMDSSGYGTSRQVARAIGYAVDNGADVINLSFAGSRDDIYMAFAIERAFDRGVLVIAAVGNGGNGFGNAVDLDAAPQYPACSEPRGENLVLGVGSLNRDNTKASFSNYGSCLDISAPGTFISAPQFHEPALGGIFNHHYRGGWRGTSTSAPILAGIAGLMKSANPNLTPAEIISVIKRTAKPLDDDNSLFRGRLGAGLVNAGAAVARARDFHKYGNMAISTPVASR